MTPARGERHVHFSDFSPEPAGLRHRHGHQSDLNDLFTGPAGGSTNMFSRTQVCLFYFIFILYFYFCRIHHKMKTLISMCPLPRRWQPRWDQDFKMNQYHLHLPDSSHVQSLGLKKRPKVVQLILYLFSRFMRIKQSIANFVCMWSIFNFFFVKED